MRSLVVLVLVAGCPRSDPGPCTTDADCGDFVCARDGECLSAAEVRRVQIVWTVHGMPASATTCAAIPDLYLQLDSPSDSFGFEPVPCMAGQFTIDKLPRRYYGAELGVTGKFNDVAQFDSSSVASLDLNP